MQWKGITSSVFIYVDVCDQNATQIWNVNVTKVLDHISKSEEEVKQILEY